MQRDYQDAKLIAPCGMNCLLCNAFNRKKNPCAGCRGEDANKPVHCRNCIIYNCPAIQESQSGFCFDCDKMPCRRLKILDKRYRSKYHMSMLDNLSMIHSSGMETFLKSQHEKWTCKTCGGVVSVHHGTCFSCGAMKEF